MVCTNTHDCYVIRTLPVWLWCVKTTFYHRVLFAQIMLAQNKRTVHVECTKRISTVSAGWCSRKVLFARSSILAEYFCTGMSDIQDAFSLAANAAAVAAARISPFRIYLNP